MSFKIQRNSVHNEQYIKENYVRHQFTRLCNIFFIFCAYPNAYNGIHTNGIVLFLNRNPNKPFCVLNFFFQRHTYKTTKKRKGNQWRRSYNQIQWLDFSRIVVYGLVYHNFFFCIVDMLHIKTKNVSTVKDRVNVL